jgi:hypothetical protein
MASVADGSAVEVFDPDVEKRPRRAILSGTTVPNVSGGPSPTWYTELGTPLAGELDRVVGELVAGVQAREGVGRD